MSSNRRRARPGELVTLAGMVVCAAGVPLAMAPNSYNRFGPAKLLALALGLSLLLISVVLDLPSTKGVIKRLWALPMVKALVALSGVIVLACAVSSYPLRSLVGAYPEYAGAWFAPALLLVALGAVLVAESPRRQLFWTALAASLAVVVAYAIVQALGLDPLRYREGLVLERLRSTLGNASNLGVYLLLVTPLVTAWLWFEKHARILAAATLAAATFALVRTGSRGALLGAVVASAVVLVTAAIARHAKAEVADAKRRPVSTSAWKPVGIGIAALLLLTVAVLTTPGMVDRISGISLSSEDAQWRFSLWGSAARAIADRPVLGWGPDSFRYVYPAYRDPALSELRAIPQETTSPHNVILETGTAAGAAGLAALLALALLWGQQATRRVDQRSIAPTAALAGAIVALQFHFVTLDSLPLLGVAIGVSLADVRQPAAITTQQTTSRAQWPLLVAAGVVGSVAVLGALGLVLADSHIAAGFSKAAGGDEWANVEREFDAAAALAPWEPAVLWAAGKASTDHITATQGIESLGAGEVAFSDAVDRLPPEPHLLRDRADLYYAAGVAAGESGLLARALELYGAAGAADPYNAVPLIGQGVTLIGLGRFDEAADTLQEAVTLAPESGIAWHNLAAAYSRAGDSDKAKAALERASVLGVTE